ncbi:hypothetical protein [Cetobacterium sp.]|uniref:hypothetical protein n=1 Tax=Cetobacterium sp. TaxID=2071632 RepID=UPI003F2CBDE5
MKIITFLIFLIMYSISFSEIKLKIHEPMRFENINMTTLTDTIVGKATIELSTDNIEEDFGKKLVFKFPESGLMTNKKRWLKIEKYMMEESDKNIVLENERRLINIYAVIDRKVINNGEIDVKFLEGEYVGYLPIIVSQYSEIKGKSEMLKDKTKNQ